MECFAANRLRGHNRPTRYSRDHDGDHGVDEDLAAGGHRCHLHAAEAVAGNEGAAVGGRRGAVGVDFSIMGGWRVGRW
jgi:hypothetical protein